MDFHFPFTRELRLLPNSGELTELKRFLFCSIRLLMLIV